MAAKKTKILYLVTQSELGGAQKNVLDLANGLKAKYDILVAAGPDGGGKLFKQLADKKIRYFELRWLRRNAANPLVDTAGLFEIIGLLFKEKPDLIHLHSSKAGFLGAIAGKIMGIRVIYTVHGAVFEASFSRLAKQLFLLLEGFSAYFKDKIICVSDNDLRVWLKYDVAPAQKLTVVYNGLDLTSLDFLPQPAAREHLFSQSANLFEAAQGSKDELKIIGTIANFFPEKGLPYLIEAADILINKKQLQNLLFVVIGEGPDRLLLEEIIEDHQLQNKFILTGSVSNAAKYLKAFDVFTAPSTKEGRPYVIMEAMAAGLPIVASHVGGIPELIKNNQEGFLVWQRDSEALAEKILELLNNKSLAQQFGLAAQQKAQGFSLDKMIAATEKVYFDEKK